VSRGDRTGLGMIGEGTLVGLAALDATLPESPEPTWSVELARPSGSAATLAISRPA
jgi:hypothetical protein